MSTIDTARAHRRQLGELTHRLPTPWSTLVLATLVVVSSLYGLLAAAPYRSLPEATVRGAQAQDAVSIAVAVLLMVLAVRHTAGVSRHLLHLGLMGYLAYSYLIYLAGVPMNRMFLAYVAIVALSGSVLARGLVDVLRQPPPGSAHDRLRTTTGWMLLVTSLLFAGLWLATLLPYALGGASPEPQGVGGTPYPVFRLDLAVVLPAIGAVGVMLLRDRPAGPAVAVVALVKIVTLFTALWAGPAVAFAAGRAVELGPDAVPSLVLLAASGWLLTRWHGAFSSGTRQGHP